MGIPAAQPVLRRVVTQGNVCTHGYSARKTFGASELINIVFDQAKVQQERSHVPDAGRPDFFLLTGWVAFFFTLGNVLDAFVRPPNTMLARVYFGVNNVTTPGTWWLVDSFTFNSTAPLRLPGYRCSAQYTRVELEGNAGSSADVEIFVGMRNA